MFDVLIIGAGPSGLCAAKTILESEDGVVNLRLVDSNKTVGGVWAKENLYPGLKTNNLRGGIDFSDFPMHDGFGIAKGKNIPGEVMHEYFRQYAQKWDILRRISFETSVLEISKLEAKEGWNVKIRQASAVSDLQTRKLIVATGITNEPHRPVLERAEAFGGPIIHSAELGLKSGPIMKDPAVRTVTVLGGGKSAYDAVYLAACAGKEVEWVMRKSGKGPAWVFPAFTNLGPFKAWREKLTTRRFISCFSPCFWQDGLGWLRNFLHFTTLGKKIAQKFWLNIHMATLDDCGYVKSKELNILEPETNPFWYGTASGVYSYEQDLFGFIKSGQVRCHREDITELSSKSVHLANGVILPSDALITATGFSVKPTIAFTPSALHSDLGIPTTELTPPQRDFWRHLNHKAELTIASLYPRLLIGPFRSPSSTIIQPYNPGLDPDLQYTPFRLYRAIAPPGLAAKGDRSLVFIGMFSNIAATVRLELQCLWAYAYLNNAIDIDESTVFDESALMARYARYRSPYGHGRFFPDIVFDQMPYFDMLLQDLGLPYWRKSWWGAELFASYGQADYQGIVREWKEKTKEMEVAGKGGGGNKQQKAVTVDEDTERLLT